jgi:hypothetical protein
MELIFTAIARKLIFVVLLFGSYEIFDHFMLHGFSTPEVLKNDAKAIALLLGLLAVAVALA